MWKCGAACGVQFVGMRVRVSRPQHQSSSPVVQEKMCLCVCISSLLRPMDHLLTTFGFSFALKRIISSEEIQMWLLLVRFVLLVSFDCYGA